MPEASTPAAPALKEDETIINPFFMQQLLEYGIGLGQQGRVMDRDELLREAEVEVHPTATCLLIADSLP